MTDAQCAVDLRLPALRALPGESEEIDDLQRNHDHISSSATSFPLVNVVHSPPSFVQVGSTGPAACGGRAHVTARRGPLAFSFPTGCPAGRCRRQQRKPPSPHTPMRGQPVRKYLPEETAPDEPSVVRALRTSRGAWPVETPQQQPPHSCGGSGQANGRPGTGGWRHVNR